MNISPVNRTFLTWHLRRLIAAGSICIALAAIAAGPATTAPVDPPKVTAVPPELRERLHLDRFYNEYLDDQGLPILASEKCEPYALLEAHDILDHMLAHRPAVREALIKARVRVVIMATTEMTTDVPEQRDLTPREYWDRRARGLGGKLVSCGEENLLHCPGDPYRSENILIHEFSHAIQDVAMPKVDPTFQKRVRAAYDAAVQSGAWDHSYAASNMHEYFAEGSQAWFNAGRNSNHSSANNGIGTREKLKKADPQLAGLCAEVFGDDAWRYVPPERRDDLGALAGLDRSSLPRFAWPQTRPATRP